MILFGWEIAVRRVRPPATCFDLEVSLLCNDGSHIHPRMTSFRAEQVGRLREIMAVHDGPPEVWKLCKHVRQSVVGIEVRLPLKAWGFVEDRYVRIGGELAPVFDAEGKEEEWVTYTVHLGGFVLC